MQQAHFMLAWVSATLDGRYAVAMEDHKKAAKLTERLNHTGVLAAYAVPDVPMVPMDKLQDAAATLLPSKRLKQLLTDRRCALRNPLPGVRGVQQPLHQCTLACRRADSSPCRVCVSP